MALKKRDKTKYCPLLDRDCLKEQCAIHHGEFDRCIIDLIAYNLYALVAALKNPLKGRDD